MPLNKFMKKIDNKSYVIHNSEYETTSDLNYCKQRFAEYEANNEFERLGFKEAIEMYPENRSLFVDIGSGAGWMLIKASPIFKKVIGVEPSKSAVDVSKQLTSDLPNVEHVNSEMIAAMQSLNISEPTFFVTSTVLSHIEDDTVKVFLKSLNEAPKGSVLMFGEPYGKNRNQYVWHIRSKEWWARQLCNWELTFCGQTGNGYLNGIRGVCVGKENVKNNYHMSCVERMLWHLSGIPSRIKYLGRIILNLFK